LSVLRIDYKKYQHLKKRLSEILLWFFFINISSSKSSLCQNHRDQIIRTKMIPSSCFYRSIYLPEDVEFMFLLVNLLTVGKNWTCGRKIKFHLVVTRVKFSHKNFYLSYFYNYFFQSLTDDVSYLIAFNHLFSY
jgi:hypothetical protein